MIFARNDLVLFPDDNERYRLLAIFPASNTAFFIATSPGRHMPFEVDLALFREESRADKVLPAPVVATNSVPTQSQNAKDKAIRDWESIRDLVMYRRGADEVEQLREDIFHPALRHALVVAHAKRTGIAMSTLYARLCRWWVGGQVRDALVSVFHRRGSRSLVEGVRAAASRKNKEAKELLSLTSGRGKKPEDGRPIFQWSATSITHFRDRVLQAQKDAPDATLKLLFDEYRDQHYAYVDGNGQSYPKPEGERPSDRQMYKAYKALIAFEDRVKAVVGAGKYKKDHRAKTGSAQEDCDGIGHQYEIDATLADVWLRSRISRRLIVGKATLVLIVDRKSFLIVGFYVGFEQDSWLSSREAIFSIFEDKQALCARYGIPYDPADWPAHGVLPLLFLADRGPMAASESYIVVGGLRVGIKNLPANRPDWKPYVECSFRLVQGQLATFDGFEPSNRAERRRGKKYALDATMNLHEFTAEILNLIIAHNRRPGTTDHLTADQALRGIQPIPTEIWRDEEANRMGLLARVDEATARASLLHEENAVATPDGILFRGAYYTCPTAIEEAWFDQARLGRGPITVRFDRRLCDSIYIQLPKADGHSPLEVATLCGDSVEYKGLSFAEMKTIVKAKAALEKEAKAIRDVVDHQARVRSKGLKAPYQNAAKAATKGMSAAAQTRDAKATKLAERALERQERGAPPKRTQPEAAKVLPFERRVPASTPATQTMVMPPSVLSRIHQEMFDDDVPN